MLENPKHIKAIVFAIVFTLFSVNIGFSQFDIPPKPAVKDQKLVNDYIGLLSRAEFNALNTKLERYNDSTSTQIVVAIISSTNGENIGLLTPKWGHEWGVGQAKEDNGVFILLAKDDRDIWISPGYGAEEKLTAGRVGQLTRNAIIPQFKKGDYYGGLDKGTDAIIEILAGTYKGQPKGGSNKEGFPVIIIIITIFIIILIVLSKDKRGGGGNGGRRSRNDSILDAIIFSNMGRGSFGGGSSSGGFGGGGFGGFGGGGFSGGGAGGSW
ncbi:MAG: methanol dehydrogenase [Bacteroidetes bacterium MedPE-SWsnd-G2]|nr:MAG: methanol dehydrogenase [Bacteroidetes bacterium MedPE-SWsnd-G2]